MDSVASFRFLKSMQSLQPVSGLRTKCICLYSDAVDFSMPPRDSNRANCFLRSISLSRVRNRGVPRFFLLAHLDLSTIMDRGGTLAGYARTVGENISPYSRHNSLI
jgi:hypothetical protein